MTRALTFSLCPVIKFALFYPTDSTTPMVPTPISVPKSIVIIEEMPTETSRCPSVLCGTANTPQDIDPIRDRF